MECSSQIGARVSDLCLLNDGSNLTIIWISQSDVPQQGNTLNCGLFTIWFTSEMVKGRTDMSQWTFTAADCENERSKVLARLCSALHTDMQEHNVQQLEHVGFLHQGSDENDLELGIATVEKSVADEVHPLLLSTDFDAGRRMSVKDWKIARDR
jgi:hypothetical protein